MEKNLKKMRKAHIKRWTDLYNEQIFYRIEKRKRLEGLNINPYKNNLSPNVSLGQLREKYGQFSQEELVELHQQKQQIYHIAGRAVLARSFGKAGFFTLDDGSQKLQLYVRKGDVSNENFSEYKVAEYGDILYAEGFMFRTNKGELSLHATRFHILTKSLRPLPEKFHGLSDPELRYRMRYVDMIMNPRVREVFKFRSQMIRLIREFFHGEDFLEVETPMLHSIAGGGRCKTF